MSLTSGPIAESEQAAEKAADHIGAASVPVVVSILKALFQFVWKTRITIDISERP